MYAKKKILMLPFVSVLKFPIKNKHFYICNVVVILQDLEKSQLGIHGKDRSHFGFTDITTNTP